MKKTIWYIDRDEEIAAAIQAQQAELEPELEVIPINNPIVIDEKLKETLPDLIFMDILIACQNEGGIIRELKSQNETKKIPIILTAMDFKIEEKAKELGADSFLGKPFDIKQFFETAKEQLKK